MKSKNAFGDDEVEVEVGYVHKVEVANENVYSKCIN